MLILLSAALMLSDYRYAGLDKVRYYLGTVTDPIYYAANLSVKATGRVYQWIENREQLLEENKTLKQENLRLNSELKKYAALEHENRRLSELLKSSYRRSNGNAVVAKIIATNYTHFRQRIVLNKGGSDKVYVGQPILGPRGVIGQVVTVTPLSAVGMLISDPDHAMLTQVKRSGLRALAVGTGDPRRLRLDHVPLGADVKRGDVIVTSSLAERYPPDYPVGRISHVVQPDNDNFATVYLEPFIELDSHREVLLAWKEEEDDGAATQDD